MTADPEATYALIADARPGAVRDDADSLRAAQRVIDRAGDDLYEATGVPVWSGAGATAFQIRAAGLLQGVRANFNGAARLRGALETAADALDSASQQCDQAIGYWRNRPPGMPGFIEDIFAKAVDSQLRTILHDYDHALSGIDAVLAGRTDVDTSGMDDETRTWVERGLDQSDDWYDTNNSTRGPLIPGTEASGHDGGLVPQGLGYDPASGLLMQTYYDEHDPDRSTMSLVDPQSGQQIGQVQLGGNPGHAGGVAVDGGHVIVTSGGKLYTYSLNDIQNASPGQTVPTVGEPQPVSASSYGTIQNGTLYVGDFYHNKLYSYHKDSAGQWVPNTNSDGTQAVTSTPDNVQGLSVVDGHYVFSTSSGRTSGSDLVTQDMDTGDRSEPYPMPNMAEGVVPVNGQLVTTYESGAGEYDREKGGWPWEDHTDELWASPYMTRTPLTDLGLSDEVSMQPDTLTKASGLLGDPASDVNGVSHDLGAVSVTAGDLGRVPSAASFAQSVTDKTGSVADSLHLGATAIRRLATDLTAARRHNVANDERVAGRMHGHH